MSLLIYRHQLDMRAVGQSITCPLPGATCLLSALKEQHSGRRHVVASLQLNTRNAWKTKSIELLTKSVMHMRIFLNGYMHCQTFVTEFSQSVYQEIHIRSILVSPHHVCSSMQTFVVFKKFIFMFAFASYEIVCVLVFPIMVFTPILSPL